MSTRIAFVASEAVPFAKTGGLADVVGALPQHLSSLGYDVVTIMPRYRGIRCESQQDLRGDDHGPVRLCHSGNAVFVDYPDYFDREGLYGTPQGDYPDNAERFILFCKAALEAIKIQGCKLAHCHDWQSGLVPLYLRERGSSTRSVFTIHNLGYQGLFPAEKFRLLGIPERHFGPEGIEFYGQMNFLKAGIVYSDRVTTVSESYAREIQTPEQGFGLDGVLRRKSHGVLGILNGIDYREWDPARDRFLTAPYSTPEGKLPNKKALCAAFRLSAAAPLCGMVTRIASQKGFDILIPAIERLVGLGYSLLILGFGEAAYHEQLQALAKRLPGKIGLALKFDNRLAHQIYAGSDFFLMPSRYEPCGLGQLISFRYATVPVVFKIGGLADTVSDVDQDPDNGRGIVFGEYRTAALEAALVRARALYDDHDRLTLVRRRIAGLDYSWGRSAARYAQLYAQLLSEQHGG